MASFIDPRPPIVLLHAGAATKRGSAVFFSPVPTGGGIRSSKQLSFGMEVLVMAYAVMAYIVMAYILMAYIVMTPGTSVFGWR